MSGDRIIVKLANWFNENANFLFISCVIIGFTAYVMLPFLTTPLIFDTLEFILLFQDHSFLEIISFSGLTYYQRPIGFFLLYSCYLAFGINPIGWRIVSSLLYVVGTCMVYFTTNKLFQNQYLAGASTFIFLLFSVFYFEVLYWCACYFYLLCLIFVFLGVYCYMNFKIRDRGFIWFIGMTLFFYFAILSNEIALFTIPAFALFEFVKSEKVSTFFRKEIWKYLLFIPIILYTMISLSISPSPVKVFLRYFFGVYIVIFVIYLGGLLGLIYVLKTKPYNTPIQFTSLLTYLSFMGLILQPCSRTIYIPLAFSSILIVAFFISPRFKTAIEWTRHCLKRDFWRKKNLKRILPFMIIITVFILLICRGFSSARYAGMVPDYISNQIIASGISNDKTIYLVNFNLYPNIFTWEIDIERFLEIKTGFYYNILSRRVFITIFSWFIQRILLHHVRLTVLQFYFPH